MFSETAHCQWYTLYISLSPGIYYFILMMQDVLMKDILTFVIKLS